MKANDSKEREGKYTKTCKRERNLRQESERKRTDTNRHWVEGKKDAVSMEIGRKRERKAGVGP